MSLILAIAIVLVAVSGIFAILSTILDNPWRLSKNELPVVVIGMILLFPLTAIGSFVFFSWRLSKILFRGSIELSRRFTPGVIELYDRIRPFKPHVSRAKTVKEKNKSS